MSKSKKSKEKQAKQKMKKTKKPPVMPQRQQQGNVKLMSSEELGLMLGEQCGRIIQAQSVIQEADTNVKNLRAELQLRQKAKEKEGKNDGQER